MKRVRVDFITNQAPHYRSALWRRLLEEDSLDTRFYYGDGAGKTIRSIDAEAPSWKAYDGRLAKVTNLHWKGVLFWQRGVTGIIKNTDAHVVVLLGQMYIVTMWFSAIIARRRGIRVLFWGHGAYGHENRLKRWLRNCFLKLGDGVLVYGEHARDLLIQQGFKAERIWTVYNSLDTEQQNRVRRQSIETRFFMEKQWFDEPGFPVLLFVGRLTKQKSLDRLIAAVRRLSDTGQYFNLLLVGDGPEREYLTKLSNEVKGQVHFYGACYDEEELGRLIANSDLCVSPGEVGLTAMHSLGYGTPVCTHSDMSRQMPEAEAIVEGRTGVLFDQESMNLAGAISRWFDGCPDREYIRLSCYEEIDLRWNTENQARRIGEAIHAVATRKQ